MVRVIRLGVLVLLPHETRREHRDHPGGLVRVFITLIFHRLTPPDRYHTQSASEPMPATPHSTLINGKGRYPGGPAVDLAILNVQRGKRYRFRLVSMSCDPDFTFSIDGHRMTIIEADGQNTQPHTVDSIRIFAGTRL